MPRNRAQFRRVTGHGGNAAERAEKIRLVRIRVHELARDVLGVRGTPRLQQRAGLIVTLGRVEARRVGGEVADRAEPELARVARVAVRGQSCGTHVQHHAVARA